MNEKPILFSGEMVRAILDGRKTMTRRVAKQFSGMPDRWTIEGGTMAFDGGFDYVPLRYPCAVGDKLWVRETWYYDSHMHELTDGMPDAPDGRYLHRLVYRADSPDWQVYGGWKSPVTMPRWASRLNVTVQSVAVEQVDGGWEWVVEMVKSQP